MTPEHRAAIGAGQKRAWRDPDKRARRTAAIVLAWDDPLRRALMRDQNPPQPGSKRMNLAAYMRAYRRRFPGRRTPSQEMLLDEEWDGEEIDVIEGVRKGRVEMIDAGEAYSPQAVPVAAYLAECAAKRQAAIEETERQRKLAEIAARFREEFKREEEARKEAQRVRRAAVRAARRAVEDAEFHRNMAEYRRWEERALILREKWACVECKGEAEIGDWGEHEIKYRLHCLQCGRVAFIEHERVMAVIHASPRPGFSLR